MRRVDVQDVVERPDAVVCVQRRICARIVRRDRRVRESRNKFLDVAHPLHAGDRRAKGIVVPESEIQTA